MKRILLVLIVIFAIYNADAQIYKTAYGLKVGWIVGANAKHFISQKSAIEGDLDIQKKGFILTGTYQYHFDVKKIETFKWFIGGGAHFGLWDKSVTWVSLKEPTYIGGITAMIGIEYAFPTIPLSLALDLDPRYNLFGKKTFWAYGGISIRYTIPIVDEDEVDKKKEN